MKYRFCSAFIAALLTTVLSACSSDHDAPSAATTPQTAIPYVAIARGQVDVAGGLVQVTAQRPGVIREVRVSLGEHVKRGQSLALLDRTAVDLELALAKAKLEQARAEVRVAEAKLPAARRRANRLEAAARDDAASGQEAEDARSAVAELEATLMAARAQADVVNRGVDTVQEDIRRSTVNAPVAGQVIAVDAQVGSNLAEIGKPLFVVLPDRPHLVHAELDEGFVDLIKLGATAEVVPDSASQAPSYPGRVIYIAPVQGPTRLTDDPSGAGDARSVDCVVEIPASADWRVGQRVLVRFKRPAAT